MRESYKRFVKKWIRFVLIRQFSKDSILGFISWRSFQKICFVDSFRGFVSWIRFVMQFSKDSFRGFVLWRNFQKIRRIQRILTNPSESFGFGFANPLVFKRFVSWICFVTQFSKDSFRGFVSWRNFQKIHFVDSFRKTKNLKLLDSFRFGRIRVRIPHP